MTDDTWHRYVWQLTPEQLEIMIRTDLNPYHPGGPEGHQRGMIGLAQHYVDQNRQNRKPWWRRLSGR